MDVHKGHGGSRLRWHEIPSAVRGGIEAAMGSAVVSATSQPGGFSPGLAARLVFDDGRRAFAKAVGLERNPQSPSILRTEAGTLPLLPPTVPAPRLLSAYDDGDWVAIVLTDIEGRPPHVPWRATEFDRVLAALTALADEPDDAPASLPRLRDAEEHAICGWRLLAADPAAAARLPADLRAGLDRFAELESAWRAALAGDSLLHGDLRGDNILLTADEVVLVDWPSATAGPAWVDLLFMLPSVAMQQGPPPEEVWRAFRPARSADPDAVTTLLAAMAGYFMHRSLLPPPANLPRVRAFQRAQGDAACAWLRHRLS